MFSYRLKSCGCKWPDTDESHQRPGHLPDLPIYTYTNILLFLFLFLIIIIIIVIFDILSLWEWRESDVLGKQGFVLQREARKEKKNRTARHCFKRQGYLYKKKVCMKYLNNYQCRSLRRVGFPLRTPPPSIVLRLSRGPPHIPWFLYFKRVSRHF